MSSSKPAWDEEPKQELAVPIPREYVTEVDTAAHPLVQAVVVALSHLGYIACDFDQKQPLEAAYVNLNFIRMPYYPEEEIARLVKRFGSSSTFE